MSEIAALAPDWIAVDWGTTNLRAWAMKGDRPVARASSARGMASIDRDGFENALLETIGPWLSPPRCLPVVACGMVGARQGWIEAPYVEVPSHPLVSTALTRVRTENRQMDVTIVHGMCQTNPADVMRGEETQIAGLLALEPELDALACLPGTHSKWANLSAGRVLGFSTFITGELFSLLATQSVLRHSVGNGGEPEDEAFEDAVMTAAAEPARICTELFSIRARGLVSTMSPGQARSRLSGLLIGLEVAAMRPLWTSRSVVFVGQPVLAASYLRALTVLGGSGRSVDGEECTLGGLSQVWRQIKGNYR